MAAGENGWWPSTSSKRVTACSYPGPCATKIRLLKTIFNDAKMVCVLSTGHSDGSSKTPIPTDALLGVITKIDLITYLGSRKKA